MQGASPLASPGWAGRGTGEGGEPRARRGACPLRGGVRGGIPVPGGGRARLVACLPCLCFLFCPLSPYPLPRWGRGSQSYFMQGASPLASPGWAGRGTGEGGIPVPGGGRARLVACLPCLCFTFLPPIPLPPSPAGRGRPKLFHARGFAPCIPGLNPYSAGSTFGKQLLSVMPKTLPFNNIIEESP